MSNLSNLIDILDDDVNVHSIDSATGDDTGVVGVVSTVTLSGWVPFTSLLLVICSIVYYFQCLLILCLFLYVILLR